MSNTLTQLEPTIPVEVIGKGKGYAFGVIDYSSEHHLLWIVAMDDTGEIWTVPNPQVRIQSNWTMGRNVKTAQTDIKPDDKPKEARFSYRYPPEPTDESNGPGRPG